MIKINLNEALFESVVLDEDKSTVFYDTESDTAYIIDGNTFTPIEKGDKGSSGSIKLPSLEDTESEDDEPEEPEKPEEPIDRLKRPGVIVHNKKDGRDYQWDASKNKYVRWK